MSVTIASALAILTAVATGFAPMHHDGTSDPHCGFESQLSGPCSSASTDGSAVFVGGSEEHGGVPVSSPSQAPSVPGQFDRSTSSLPQDLPDLWGTDGRGANAVCTGDRPCYRDVPTDIDPGTPTITINDLASFRPHAPTVHAEPNGWAVIGKPTNFYLAATQHVITGTLLGQPANVRFTPAGSSWNYGDAATTTANTAGASWAQLRQSEFTETATSHTYTTKGTYTAEGSIHYTAEYQFAGSPWLPVAGSLAIPSTTPVSITTWYVKTVLVRNP